MNRTKRFFYNSLTTALYQLILMIAGFIIPFVFLRFYGSEVNGLVSSITQFFVYFKLVEAGLSGAAIYALYKPLANNDYKGINGIVSAARKLYLQAGYIFISLTFGLAFLYPILVKTESLTPFNVGLLVLILGVNGALEFFTLAKYRVLLTAAQKTYIISLASIVEVIIKTFIIVTLASLEVSIVFLMLGSLLSIISRTLILMFYVKIKYKYLNYQFEPNIKALNKKWDALYLQVLGAIHVGAPIIILTVVTGDLKLVSVYVIFNLVIMGLNGIVGIFQSGLPASFGDVLAKGEVSILQRAYSQFELFYYSLISMVYAIAFITIMPFIRIYTDGVYDINYDLPLVGFLFVLNGLLFNIKTPQGMLVISAGLFKETRVQVTIQAAIAILVGILLTPSLGIVGVLLGSIISNIYRDIDLLYFIPRNVTKLPVRKTIYRVVKIFICIGLILFPFFFIELQPGSYTSWFFTAILVGCYAIFIVGTIAMVSEPKETTSIIKRILNVLKK